MKKMKRNILTLSTALAMGTLAVNSALQQHQVYLVLKPMYGDRMITLPVDESTVDDTSVKVWFKYVKDAYGYTYDLVGSGVAIAEKGCDGTDVRYEKTGIILAADLDTVNACGVESTVSKQGDEHGDGTLGINGNVPLCEYTLPDLPDGNYALAINPIVLGSASGYSYQEKRVGTACKPTSDDLLGGPISDPAGLVPWSLAGGFSNGSLANDINYQLFSVSDASPAASVVPNSPLQLVPLGGSVIASGPVIPPSVGPTHTFVFTDDSGETGRASWYEIFIRDPSGTRVTDLYGDNNVYGQWFNVATNSSAVAPLGLGIDCVTYTPTSTGLRTCTITVNSPTLSLTGQSPNDLYTWWVKGYNGIGHGSWSVTGGTFSGTP